MHAMHMTQTYSRTIRTVEIYMEGYIFAVVCIKLRFRLRMQYKHCFWFRKILRIYFFVIRSKAVTINA